MKTSAILVSLLILGIGCVIVGGQTQAPPPCPDTAINTCLNYVTGSVSGTSVTIQNIDDFCSRISNLTYCLPMKGCRADNSQTARVRNVIVSGFNDLCNVRRDRLLNAATCWNQPSTRSKISACNSTFVNSLMSGSSYCPTAGTFLGCLQSAILTDCNPETMIYFLKFNYAALVGFTISKNCQISPTDVYTFGNNLCLPWNITDCLKNINSLTLVTGQGTNAIHTTLDSVCGKTDPISSCMTAQSCASDNLFYQSVNNQLSSSLTAICSERNRNNYYDSYAACFSSSSVTSGITSCNNTFWSNFNVPSDFCVAGNAFLQCTQNLVTQQCGTNPGTAIAAYFYSLLNINSTINSCTLDSKYAPPSSSGTTSAASLPTTITPGAPQSSGPSQPSASSTSRGAPVQPGSSTTYGFPQSTSTSEATSTLRKSPIALVLVVLKLICGFVVKF